MPKSQASRGSWSFASLAQTTTIVTVAVAPDLVFVTRETGLLAVSAMALCVLGLASATGLRAWRPTGLPAFRSLLKVEILLVIGCAMFALARGAELRDTWSQVALAPSERELARMIDLVFLLLMLADELLLWRSQLFARILLALGKRPHLLLSTSFAGMIGLGTLSLCLPWSLEDRSLVSLSDALFNMTSAVCVTGLAVNDVGAHYSTFGELVLLVGIQAGGIGIMTLGAAALAFRNDASLRSQASYARLFEADSLSELRRLVRTVIVSTLVIEICGAAVLWWLWRDDPHLGGRSAVWMALFHSVSAFCNAGFALWPDNLCGFREHSATQLVLCSLIVLGGLGFPVYLDLGRRFAARVRAALGRRYAQRRRLGIDARVVLVTTGLLIVGGTAAIAKLEWEGVLAPLAAVDRLMGALFSSITSRTAGFNTLDFGALRTPTLIVVMALMWIGGSPRSTAGGIKTSSAAVLFATFVGELRGHEPRLGRYVIGLDSVRRASAAAALSLVLLVAIVFALTCTETIPLLPLCFEAVSAFSTTGLSMGITSQFSEFGRLILVAAMFLGRVGPLTLAMAVGGRATRDPYRLPSTEVEVC